MKPIKPYKTICKHQENKKKKEKKKREEDLRESRALGPNAAVVADDGCGGEVIAFDFAHEMIIDVGLPRHLLLLCTSETFSYLCCFGDFLCCCSLRVFL